MKCERARAAIQDLVDGTLGPIRVAELQQHLDECPACAALADDLRKVRDAAASLELLEPPDHVWMQIAGRLRQEGRVQSATSPEPMGRGGQYAWLAIAATLVLAVGASLFVVFPRGNDTARSTPVATAPAGNTPGNAAAGDPVQSGVEDLRQAEKLLQSGVAKLREGLGSDQQGLPPDADRALTSNLQILDDAIAESSAALQKEPQNVAARNTLFDALQRKILLLQDTIRLMGEIRRGNASAALPGEGVNKS